MRQRAIQYHRIIFSLYFVLCFIGELTAQTLTNAPSFTIKDYKILPDAGYSFKRVLTDTSLKFTSDTLFYPTVSNRYWVKATLYNLYPNDENYVISVSGPVNYILYYADNKKNRWLARPVGIGVPNGQRQAWITPHILSGQAKNTFYLKIDLSDIGPRKYPIKLDIGMHIFVGHLSVRVISVNPQKSP